MRKLFLILSIILVLSFPACDLGSLMDGIIGEEDDGGSSTAVPSPDDDSNTLMGIPSQAVSGESMLIVHDAYTVLYSLDELVPVWVSWHVGASDLGNLPRPDRFSPDPDIADERYSVSHDDFTSSGFDRGHICPNADRNGDDALQEETFYTTNIAMQNGNLNQGEWKYLEEDVRGLVEKDGYEAYVIAGTYGKGGFVDADADIMYEYDRKDDEVEPIVVPAYFWKVIVLLNDGDGDISRIDDETDVIAVWFPNADVPEGSDWTDYVKSVDYIESQTGLDLLSSLPDDLETRIERSEYIPQAG